MKTKYLILSTPAGQLGNRLVQMGNLIAFAKSKGIKLLNPGFDKYDYAKYFEAFDKSAFCRYPLKRSGYFSLKFIRKIFFSFISLICKLHVISRLFLNEGKFYKRAGIIPSGVAKYILLGTTEKANLDDPLDSFTSQIKDSFCVFIGGWMFRAYDGFDKCTEELRSIFTPRKEYQDRIEKTVKTARINSDILVGVHIRHGDYKEHLGGIYYYGLEIYREKMQEMQELFPGRVVKFLVCSTEKFGPENFKDKNVEFGSGEQLEDMYSFAFCDYIIGPPSTFTAWASFWGKVPVQFILGPESKIKLNGFRIFDSKEFLKLDNIFFN